MDIEVAALEKKLFITRRLMQDLMQELLAGRGKKTGVRQ
jgi:hypothetical protein